MSRHDFPPDEFAERRQRIWERLREKNLDWFLIFHPASIHWLTGAEAKSYQTFQCLIVDARRERLTMFTREAERNEFADDAIIDELRTWGTSSAPDPVEAFLPLVRQFGLHGSSKIGMEVPAYYLHALHYHRLAPLVSSANAAKHDNLVHNLRLVKSPREIAYLREAARIADMSLGAIAQSLAPGRSELEIAAELYHAILSSGGDVPAVPSNIVSGCRAGHSHGSPSARRLAAGDVGNVEYCVSYKRHAVSIGRQFCIGKPSVRVRKITAIVQHALEACLAEIAVGVSAAVPYWAAEKVLTDAGLARHRVHTMGYSLGSAFPPATGGPLQLAPESRYMLQAGMVLSICPNVFIHEERLGVRIVDNVLITDTGAEVLSQFPRDLIIVDDRDLHSPPAGSSC